MMGAVDRSARPLPCLIRRAAGYVAIVLATLAAVALGRADDPAFTLSGAGTAAIDGVLSPGEWDQAGTAGFMVRAPSGRVPGRFMVMNDRDMLYLAVEIADDAARYALSIEFDNDNDGGNIETGDDILLYDPRLGFRDGFRDPLFAKFDTVDGGAADGAGAYATADGMSIYEFSHPLDSADDRHDFSLRAGDRVGFMVLIRLPDAQGRVETEFPPVSFKRPARYGDIVIQ